MKLSKRIGLNVFVIAFLYGLGLSIVFSVIVMPRFRAMEEIRAKENLARVRAVVAEELAVMDANLLSYAFWNDSVAFIEGKLPEFVPLNLSKEWLDSLKVDVFCIADAKGRVIQEAGYDPESGKALALKGFFTDRGSPAGLKLVSAPGLDGISGFSRLDDRLILLASRPVRDSAGRSPSRGRMVFGRFYADRDADRLSRLLSMEISFGPPDVKGNGGREVRGSSIRASLDLAGLDGNPAGRIELSHPAGIISQGAETWRIVTFTAIFLGGVLILALYEVVLRVALAPIKNLAASALALSESGDFSKRLIMKRDDEIGALARSFNGLLDRLNWANHNLEKRIDERTAELLSTNEELKLMGEVFAHSLEGILITDTEARILAVNPAFERISGIPAKEAVGSNPRIMKSDHHDGSFFATMWNRLSRDGSWSGEIWNRRPNGTIYPAQMSINAIRDNEGRITRFVGVLRDIGDAKRQEEIIHHQAFHDALTGLPNRALLCDRIRNAVERAKRRGTTTAVVFLDLDRFKIVNDSLGHAAGDLLLKETARRLKLLARGEDTVARLGGDEFVILLEEVSDVRVPADVALRVIKSIGRPIEMEGKDLQVGASIGIAIYPGDGTDPDTLLRNADAAMYRAKDEGRNTYRLFTAELNAQIVRRLGVESDLRRAIEAHSLQVRYQPQIDLSTGLMSGVEALVRWRNDLGELICPDEFIPLAEESDLVIDIDRAVTEIALAEMYGLISTSGIRLAINCSARALRKRNLPEKIAEILAAAGIGPEHVEMEVTETAIMSDIEESAKILKRIADSGIAIALDDFGTGYSSLGRLKRLPLDAIKIDKSFISGLLADDQDRGIVDTILSIARILRLRVVAEGVETMAQAAYLREAGCDFAQGYYYAKPLRRDELELFMAGIVPVPPSPSTADRGR